jgi:hypothetical protein
VGKEKSGGPLGPSISASSMMRAPMRSDSIAMRLMQSRIYYVEKATRFTSPISRFMLSLAIRRDRSLSTSCLYQPVVH